jgi:hypothetical protein
LRKPALVLKGFAMSRLILVVFLAFGLFLGAVPPGAHAEGYLTMPLPELTQRAEAGVASAQFSLGLRYSTGDGVPLDKQQSAYWFQKAAEQGFSLAQYLLGGQYEYGKGVPQDYEQAAHWYRKAAEKGDIEAQSNLGRMYFNGQGVPRDFVLAYALFTIVLGDGGREDTSDSIPYSPRLQLLALANLGPVFEQVWQSRKLAVQQMTPEQIEEGRAIARQWKVGQPFPTESRTGVA